MNRTTALLAAFTLTALLPAAAPAQDDDGEELSPEQIEELRLADPIPGRTGDVALPSAHATLRVPAGYRFVDAEGARHMLVDYWDNPEDVAKGVLGMLVSEDCKGFVDVETAYFFEYHDVGYVPDKDAASLDFAKVLREMQRDAKADRSRPAPFRAELVGWAIPPRYDAERKVLSWGRHLSFGDPSGETKDVLNFDMRILGRRGILNVNAVADLDAADEVSAAREGIVGAVTFDPGYAYADFDPATDGKSDWSLGALVAGGVLAAKTGLLAKIGLLLLKAWKLVLVAAVAIGALFRRIAGRGKRDGGAQA